MTIYSILSALENNRSRNAKTAILTDHINNETLKRVLVMALCPFTRFNVSKRGMPVYTPADVSCLTIDEALDKLSVIVSREITGHKALEYISNLLSSLNAEDSEVIKRVITKDLRGGFSESTVNKIWPKAIKEMPCMRAAVQTEKNIENMPFPAIFQLKMDGMRFSVDCLDGNRTYYTRQGQVFELDIDGFADGFVFDGELNVLDENGNILDRQTGNGILNSILDGGATPEEISRVIATIWDVIPREDFWKGKSNTPYAERLAILDKMNVYNHRIRRCEGVTVNNLDEVNDVFMKYLKRGEEGGILKNPKGIWQDKRSDDQVKFKEFKECELRVVGYNPGQGKAEGQIGSYICESEDGLLRVATGSGLTDIDRAEEPKIGWVVTVRFNKLSRNKKNDMYSLFLPTFVEFRRDKGVANTLAEIQAL